MYIFLFIGFLAACFILLIYFLKKFDLNEFDWFSGTLYLLIYAIFCALIYLIIFTPSYLLTE